jgi:TonB family protein
LGEGVLPLTTMAPLTKDSLEVAAPVGEVGTARPAPQPKAAPAGGQLRADARSLEIPVKVHGSRVSDAPAGVAPRTEPFEEQTSTMIVFPQGSVIRMSTAVNIGQMLVVTNLKTRQDAICRVVKVRTFTNMQGYVEVEFTHKQEGYWGVQFSGTASAPASGAVPPAVSIPAPTPAPVASSSVQIPSIVQPPAAPAVAPTVVAPVTQAGHVAPLAPPTFVPPPPAPVVTPVAQASHVPPLAPPTFVPPPPPPLVVAPVAQSTHLAPPPAPAAAKSETSFVWIGTQEEVQPAASATLTIKPGPASLSSRPAAPVRPASVEPPAGLPKIELPSIEIPQIASHTVEEVTAPARSGVLPFPAAAPPAPVAQLTLSELRGDEQAPSASADASSATTLEQLPALEEKPAESSRAVFGSLSGGASFGASRSASPETFGARLDSAISSPEETAGAPRSKNWMLIAVCVTVLFAVVGGVALYFRSQAKGGGTNVNSPGLAQQTSQSQQVAAEQNALQNSAVRPGITGPVATVTPSGAPAVIVSATSSNGGKTNQVVKPPVSKTASIMEGAVIEHPVTAQRNDATADGTPSLDPTSGGVTFSGNALPGVISSSSMAAPAEPTIQPEGPVVIGGKVAEPRLISRVLPTYPLNAKQAGIGGDVVIKTTIDQKGSVVDMHVVSGPLMLRQAALDALRRWKYEPSKLDGQPIAVQMLVTIKFNH